MNLNSKEYMNYTEHDIELLNQYYSNRRKKRNLCIVIFIVTFIMLFGYFYMKRLYFFVNRNEFELVNNKNISIEMSKLDDVSLESFILSKPSDDQTYIVPDKNELIKPGTYQLEFISVDKKTNEKVIKYLEITIVDDIPPILELACNEQQIIKNSTINLTDFIIKSEDNVDGNLFDVVQISDVDTSQLGIQNVTYQVKDSSGNMTEKTIVFTVIEADQYSNELENKNNVMQQESDQNDNTIRNNNIKSFLNGQTFLFTEGYDMSNVMTVCSSKLSQEQVSGTCVPLYDSEGIIIGAKIVLD